MVVAVQKGLDNLKRNWQKEVRGCRFGNLQLSIDAIVYEGNSFQISYVSRNNMPQMTAGQRSNYGVFIVNALVKASTK